MARFAFITESRSPSSDVGITATRLKSSSGMGLAQTMRSGVRVKGLRASPAAPDPVASPSMGFMTEHG
eukprot:CAMPEP_0179899964 /NCGR_PEP_ID=MMETSP0982-20121206/38759_1 /TAXON_ID=483367 /ORGANISM="non described non described, Strain CCMP 2436" /LENGTH=67 /DNA_ID=CAMNT_0021797975 /DNA_START=12 /DNA_END=211 /DNA_ORIENTATION=+